MLLAVDVGNTHTVLGLFDGDDLVEHWRVATEAHRTADEIAVLLRGLLAQRHSPAVVDGIALCSTVPAVLHEMRDMCARYFGDLPAVIVEPGVRTGVPVLTDNPKEVGTDRVVNALAAVTLYGGPCIVVDFGTATTFDAVSAAGEYLGGAIAPGIEISVEALQSGILYGFAGQVDGVVTRMAAAIAGPDGDPDDVTVIATGGLAPLVLDEASVVDAHEPWLTLIGLRLVFARNAAL